MELAGRQDTSSAACYATAPVDRATRSIRLLRLVGSSVSSQIRCQLECFSLATCPTYTALSYRWGPVLSTRLIKINDISFNVRKNLWDFLDRERNMSKDGYYWIDAICIDQSRTEERNHQIGLMREIYAMVRALRYL